MITPQQLAAALRAAAASLDGAAAPQASQPQGQSNNALVSPPPPPPPPAAAPSGITADQLTELIMPHIANQAIKDALGVAMRENGVANLPEARPDQYGTLYAAFQAVLARFGVGGAPTAPAGVPAGII